MAPLRYMGKILTNPNCMDEEIKSRLNAKNVAAVGFRMHNPHADCSKRQKSRYMELRFVCLIWV
jgi:hypothetical protein